MNICVVLLHCWFLCGSGDCACKDDEGYFSAGDSYHLHCIIAPLYKRICQQALELLQVHKLKSIYLKYHQWEQMMAETELLTLL